MNARRLRSPSGQKLLLLSPLRAFGSCRAAGFLGFVLVFALCYLHAYSIKTPSVFCFFGGASRDPAGVPGTGCRLQTAARGMRGDACEARLGAAALGSLLGAAAVTAALYGTETWSARSWETLCLPKKGNLPDVRSFSSR